MNACVPTEINHVKAKGTIRISWSDGHVGVYEQEYLRGYCPCAMCQGHGARINFIPVPGATLEEIRGVGNYAVEFRWRDGHATGIYTYDYLRSLCPCAECAARRADSL
jgi:DUF971 family protein